MPVVVTLDGNIGAGKTTVLQHLHAKYGYKIIEEPIKTWSPMLQRIYTEDKGHFEFQLQAWLDMAWTNRIRNEHLDQNVVVVERSPHFTREVFINALALKDKVTDDQLRILDDCYHRTADLDTPDILFYLRLDPEECKRRIKTRGREEERNISTEYVTLLHELHESTFKRLHSLDQKQPVFSIDAAQNTDIVCTAIDTQIKGFTSKIV